MLGEQMSHMPHRIILCPTPSGTLTETYFTMIPSSVSWHSNWPVMHSEHSRCYSSSGPFPLIVCTKWLLKHKAIPVDFWYLMEIFLDALLLPGSNLIDAEIGTELAFWFWRVLKLQDVSPQNLTAGIHRKIWKKSFNKVYWKNCPPQNAILTAV